MKQNIDFTDPDIEIDLDIQRCVFGEARTDCVFEAWLINLRTTADDMIPIAEGYRSTTHKETILREYPQLKENFDLCEAFDIGEIHATTPEGDPDTILTTSVLNFLFKVPDSLHGELKQLRFMRTLAEGLPND